MPAVLGCLSPRLLATLGLVIAVLRLKTAKLRRLGMSQYGVCFNEKRTRHSRVNKVLQIKIKSHILFRKTFLNVSFRSVLSESDNLFVSTWSKMEMFTKVDVSESSQFVSETT